ncbi:hypothetical protein KA344_10225 [bacterium]|nr:hypothetical protein [bacterium]
MLPISLTLMANHLAWRWELCNVIPGLNLILCPLLLPGAAWLALPPSFWRSLAKFLTIAAGVLYIFLALLLLPFACLFPQPPDEKFVLKNGDIISVSYNDQGAMGGSVFVCRTRSYGPVFVRYEGRTLRWSDPKIITLPNGRQMLSVSGEAPVDIDQFFLSGDD